MYTASTSGMPAAGDGHAHAVHEVRRAARDGVALRQARDAVLDDDVLGAERVLAVGHAGGRHRIGDEDDVLAAHQLVHVTHEREGSTWMESQISSATAPPRAASERNSAIGPVSRWCSGRMPLNRCVIVARGPRLVSTCAKRSRE